MRVRMFLQPEPAMQGDRLPTSTEISRIRHSIRMLLRNEVSWLEKMSNGSGDSDCPLVNDIRQHALEINWGWQELRGLVETLPDFFLDKNRWLEESVNGLERSADFCEWAHQKESGHRYPFRGME